MPPHDEDDDSAGHFRPETWKVALEATQDVRAPSCEIKAAAERLVVTELLQQAIGWFLLTQIGVLLGSFAPGMTVGVCLLSWAIFMLEAMLKVVRNWTHRQFFMDVPCAYVPIHEEAAHDTLNNFERFLIAGALVEVILYVPYIFVIIQLLLETRMCFGGEEYEDDQCKTGGNLLEYLLLICGITTIVHGVTSLRTVWTFDSAMGVGIFASLLGKKQTSRQKPSWERTHSCACNKRGCKGGNLFKSPRTHFDRVLCLTWWVHMARHQHLSAVVASAQHDVCGLPGHWFESIPQLKRIVEECVVTGAGDHVMDSAGPLWVSQEMGLRGLVSLAKQGQVDISREILRNRGFHLLVQVVREGKISACRGLAAATIGVLATQHEAIKRECVDLAVAVIPLKRLARSKEHGLKEVALGALLNTVLNDEQCGKVCSELERSDGILGKSSAPFMGSLSERGTLMQLAEEGPTTRCQELAIGLLARLAGDSTNARAALMDIDGIKLLVALLQHGLTAEIKASAAGALAELAFKVKDGKTIGKGKQVDLLIDALVQALKGESRIAHASARALCNLALKGPENRPKIVSAGGIEHFLALLSKEREAAQYVVKEREAAQCVIPVEEQVQAEAAKALWILSQRSPQNQVTIVNGNAIPSLVELLWNSHPKVHIQGVAALSGLAWRNERNQDLIGQEGTIFPRLVRMLNTDDKNMEDKVLEKVASAICSFAENHESNRDKLLKAGALAPLKSIYSARRERMHKDRAMLKVNQAIECLQGNNDG